MDDKVDDKVFMALLQAETAWLRRRRLLMLLLGTGLLFAAPILLLGLVDLAVPLRESTAFKLCAVAALITGIWLALGGWRLARKLPTIERVALQLEDDCPDLMDSLICAVELLRRPGAKLTGLNQALIARVEAELANRNLHQTVTVRELRPGLTALLAGITVGLLMLGHFMPFGAKARAHFRDRLAGTNSGITVRPGNFELAAGDDLVIEADIHRGPKESASIVIEDSRGVISYEMYARADGRFSWEIYGVDGDFGYFVRTPVLESPRYRVRTFRRPAIVTARITVTPPAYTRQPERSYPELRNLAVPEGSRVHFRLESNMAVKAVLKPQDGAPLEFTASKSRQNHQAELTVRETVSYRIALDDLAGHVVESGRSYRIEVLEDFPPLVRVITPEKDSAVRDKNEEVTFAFQVTDDYGLTRVELLVNINGNGWKKFKLFAEEGKGPALDKIVAEVLKLDGIVNYGDIVSYYGQALDNAEPKAKIGRTDIRFLEIRPPKPEERECDGEGKGEKLTVADLIIEQKRLIKQTFGLDMVRERQQRHEMMAELTKAAGDLHMAARQRFNKIKTKAENQKLKLGKFARLFDDSVRDMSRAEDLLGKELPEESLAYQQAALSHLIKIEIELEKNAVRSKGKSGEGQEQREVSEQDEAKEREEKLARLQESLAKLKLLIQRQENLNRRLARAAAQGASVEERNYLARKQQELAAAPNKLKRDIRNAVPEAYVATRELEKAAVEMRQTKKQVEKNQTANARRHGEQARRFLERGKEMLEELRRELSGSQLAEALNRLQRLAQRQQQLRRRTETEAAKGKGAVSRETGKKMAGKQRGILKDYHGLLDQLDKAAEEFEDSNPKAARELAEGMEQAMNNRVGAKMKRAENALKYRQMKRAAQYQKEVEQALGALAEKLAKALKQPPQLSPQQLSKMLENTLEHYRGLEQAGKGKLTPAEQQKLQEQIKKDLREMARRLTDQTMNQILREIEGLGQGDGGDPLDPKIKALVARTARLLERKLFAAALRQKLKLSRITGRRPPDEYRKLVEEYFKNLSNIGD